MAEPTLKDVLNAISTMRREMATKKDVEAVRDDVAKLDAKVEAVRDDVEAMRSDVEGVREELSDKIDALDKKLDTFRDAVSHSREDTRDLEADVVAIHKGLVRAKVPGIPADLPSEVRAKGGKLAAKRPAARARRR